MKKNRYSLFLLHLQVSDRDDRLLEETLQKLTNMNTEVDGDADSEEEEDTGMGEVDVDKPNFTE